MTATIAPTATRSEPAQAPLPSPVRRNAVWWTIQLLLRFLFILWFRYRARGVSNVPVAGGALILSNHQSFLDPLLVGLPLDRPVSYVARDSLFRVPAVGWILRRTYVMPINRDAASSASIKEGVRRLRHGFLVGMFPEGTRTRDGKVGEIKPGFVALARRAGLPILPVGIAGAFEAFPRHTLFPRPRRICVVFGEPISAADVEQLSARGHESELVRVVAERITACQRQADDWRRRG